MDTDTKNIYSFQMKTIDGAARPLAEYKGKVCLVVNTASECGYTPQYAGLEELYRKYKDRGFKLLAFPANNFGAQEPGTDAQIKTFCSTKFHVSFDLFSKISVNGADKHPLYVHLTKESPFPGDITWNFEKFLIDKHGRVAARFDPAVEPTDPQITGKLEKLL